MILPFGAESTSHGLKYQSHQDSFEIHFKIKLNAHSLLPFCHIISLSLHGPINSYADVYVADQLEHIPLLPKNNIPPDI